MSEYKYRVSLFYSYCHIDERYRDRMETALALMRDNGFLSEWSDRKIIAGTPFSPQIIKELNNSDLVVYLVSPDFLASEACKDEWRRARKNAEETGQRLVPIILRQCAWKDFDNMKDYLALPRDGKPISQWDDEDAAWQDVYEQVKRVLEDIRSTFDIREEYRRDISSTEFISQFKDRIEINDLFVFPNLVDLSDPNMEGKVETVDSLDELSELRHVVLRGVDQSGKTTLCRNFLLHLVYRSRPAMLIDLEEAGSKKPTVDFFQRKFTEQLKGDYGYWRHKPDKTIILDNLSARTIGYVELAKEHFQNIVVATSENVFMAYFRDETRLSDFKHVKILELKHSQQEDLIRNWKRLDPEIRAGRRQLSDGTVDKIERDLNTIISVNKVVPRYPFFVLTILQTYEAVFKPQDLKYTAYGHCYHALMIARLAILGLDLKEFDSCFNFLGSLAYAVRRSPDGQLAIKDEDFRVFEETYKKEYVALRESTQNRLFDQRYPILSRKNGEVHFSWPYIYYFCLGYYISRHFRDSQEIQEMVAEMVEKSYIKDYAHALVFTIHHSSEQKIMEEILQHTKRVLEERKPVRLDPAETKVFDELLQTLPINISSERSIDEERSVARSQRDVLECEAIDDVEDSDYDQVNELYKALKSMEILSQIVTNKYGSIRVRKLTEMIEAISNTGLKLASVFLLDGSEIDELARFVRARLDEQESPLDVSEQSIREGVSHFTLVLVLASIENAVLSISKRELERYVVDLCEEKDSAAYDLIHCFFKIDTADRFTESHRNIVSKTLKKNRKNELVKRVLAWKVQHYFNTHRVREPIKQSTLALLLPSKQPPKRQHS